MAVTAQDRMYLSPSGVEAAQQYTNDYDYSASIGDSVGMSNARSGLEALRNDAGYYTNPDGSFAGWLSDYDRILGQSQLAAKENNALAQANAQAAWNFNREEAQKARDWSEYMSSTAHQREVRDLIAAGLNPVLSAGGQGASSGQAVAASGSSADVDKATTTVFGQYLNQLINAATQLESTGINAATSLNVAKMQTEMQKQVAQISYAAQKYAMDMQYRIAEDFPSNGWRFFGPLLRSLTNELFPGNDDTSALNGSTSFDYAKLADRIIDASSGSKNEYRMAADGKMRQVNYKLTEPYTWYDWSDWTAEDWKDFGNWGILSRIFKPTVPNKKK